MNYSPKYLIRILEEHGFIFKRSKGSHRIYYNLIYNITVVVPLHGSKDVKKVLFMQFLNKQESIKSIYNPACPLSLLPSQRA